MLQDVFAAVHHIVECWENLGLFMGVVIGPLWYPIFKQCGAILLEMHNDKPEIHTLRRCAWISNVGLAYFSMRVPLANDIGGFVSEFEEAVSLEFKLLAVMPLPGEMFRVGQSFMQENYTGPLAYVQERANELAMKAFLQKKTALQVVTPPPVGSTLSYPAEDFSAEYSSSAAAYAPAAAAVDDGWLSSTFPGYEPASFGWAEAQYEDHYGAMPCGPGAEFEQLGDLPWSEDVGPLNAWLGPSGIPGGTPHDVARPAVQRHVLQERGRGKGKGRGGRDARGRGRGDGRGGDRRPYPAPLPGGVTPLHWEPKLNSKAHGAAPWVRNEVSGQMQQVCIPHACHPPPGAPKGCVGNCIRDPAHPLAEPNAMCQESHLPFSGSFSTLSWAKACEFGGLRSGPRMPPNQQIRQRQRDVYVRMWQAEEQGAPASTAVGFVDSWAAEGGEDDPFVPPCSGARGHAGRAPVGVGFEIGPASVEDKLRWGHPDMVALHQRGELRVAQHSWAVLCYGSDMYRLDGSLRVQSCVFLVLGFLLGRLRYTSAQVEHLLVEAYSTMGAVVPPEFAGLFDFCSSQVLHRGGKPISVDAWRIAKAPFFDEVAVFFYHHTNMGLMILEFVSAHGTPRYAVEAFMFDGHLMALVHESVQSDKQSAGCGAPLQSYAVVSARAASVVASGQGVVHRVARCVSLTESGNLGHGPKGTEVGGFDTYPSVGSLWASVLDFDQYDELDATLRACGASEALKWRQFAEREVAIKHCHYSIKLYREREKARELIHCWAIACSQVMGPPRLRLGLEYGGNADDAGLPNRGARQFVVSQLDKKLQGELCPVLSEFDTASVQTETSSILVALDWVGLACLGILACSMYHLNSQSSAGFLMAMFLAFLITATLWLKFLCTSICREKLETDRKRVQLRSLLRATIWWMRVGRLPLRAQLQLVGDIGVKYFEHHGKGYCGDVAVWMFCLAELLWLVRVHATGPPRGRHANWVKSKPVIFSTLLFLRSYVWDSTLGFEGEGPSEYSEEAFEFDKAQAYSLEEEWVNSEDYPEAPWGSFVMAAGGMVTSAEGFDKDVVKSVERMIRAGSPEIMQLQPLVEKLKMVTPLVAEDRAAQGQYLKHIRNLTEACYKLCPNRWWPQLFLSAYRADHVGRSAPDVYPEEVRDLFEEYLPPVLFEKLLQHATEGQHAYTYAPRWRQRSKTAPSAMQHINEVWRTAWSDTSLARTFTFPPDCMKYMDVAEISCYPLSRVPK